MLAACKLLCGQAVSLRRRRFKLPITNLSFSRHCLGYFRDFKLCNLLIFILAFGLRVAISVLYLKFDLPKRAQVYKTHIKYIDPETKVVKSY